WPTDGRYDPELLADGDRRNVVDRYRYWTREAVVADLDTRRHPCTSPSRTGGTT
ncbi:MAG: trmH, partial [Mycobacterium sp.]|nr:trmH [Mycobacterium sp.]